MNSSLPSKRRLPLRHLRLLGSHEATLRGFPLRGNPTAADIITCTSKPLYFLRTTHLVYTRCTVPTIPRALAPPTRAPRAPHCSTAARLARTPVVSSRTPLTSVPPDLTWNSKTPRSAAPKWRELQLCYSYVAQQQRLTRSRAARSRGSTSCARPTARCSRRGKARRARGSARARAW